MRDMKKRLNRKKKRIKNGEEWRRMDKNQRKWIKRTRPDRIGSEWMKTNKTEKKNREN